MPIPDNKVPTRKLPAPLYGIQKKLRNRNLTPEEIAWDDYLIPGLSWPVLRNKVGSKKDQYGCPDGDVLAQREERFTAFRMIELKKEPIRGNFDLEHMKRIHHHLLQDVYEWAGEPRTVFLSKAGHDYAEVADIEKLWGEVHETLEHENFLRDIESPEEFAEQLAFHWGMVNVAHAFREGNTRSQTLFFHQLAKEAGWDLNVAMLGPDHARSIRDEFVEARFHHQENNFDERPLAAVLAKVITRREPELHRVLGHEAQAPAPAKHTWARPKQALPVPVVPVQVAGAAASASERSPWAEALEGELTAEEIAAGAADPKVDLDARFRRYPELTPDGFFTHVDELTAEGIAEKGPEL